MNPAADWPRETESAERGAPACPACAGQPVMLERLACPGASASYRVLCGRCRTTAGAKLLPTAARLAWRDGPLSGPRGRILPGAGGSLRGASVPDGWGA